MITSPVTCPDTLEDAMMAIWFAMSMGSAIFLSEVLSCGMSVSVRQKGERRISVIRGKERETAKNQMNLRPQVVYSRCQRSFHRLPVLQRVLDHSGADPSWRDGIDASSGSELDDFILKGEREAVHQC
jgi:hypothetical protein